MPTVGLVTLIAVEHAHELVVRMARVLGLGRFRSTEHGGKRDVLFDGGVRPRHHEHLAIDQGISKRLMVSRVEQFLERRVDPCGVPARE